MRVAAILVLVVATPALAETQLPIYDVDALCAQMGKNANWCVHDEQDRYNTLKSFEWDRLSERNRQVCLRISAGPRPRAYYLLEGCVIKFLSVEDQMRRQEESAKFQP